MTRARVIVWGTVIAGLGLLLLLSGCGPKVCYEIAGIHPGGYALVFDACRGDLFLLEVPDPEPIPRAVPEHSDRKTGV